MLAALPFLLLSSAPLLARAYVPATASASQPVGNATLQGKWTTVGGSGVFGGQLVNLVQGDGSGVVASNTTASYGIITNLNETSALLMNRTVVPFFALVSCDSNVSTTASPLLPSAANSTLNATTIDTNSSMKSTVRNETSLDVFSLAGSLGAQGVILYSAVQESCVLNTAYLTGNFSKPVPIYTSPTLAFSKVIMQQLANVNSTHTQFNSTSLNLAYASLNLTSTPTSAIAFSSALVDYLVGTIAYYNSSASTNQSSSPTYATVGHASPSSTGTVGGSSGTSGAEAGRVMSLGLVIGAGALALWV